MSFVLSPTNAIFIYGDGGKIDNYFEVSEIRGNDLIVTLYVDYMLDAEFFKYRNSSSFTIRPWHGAWHDSIRNFRIDICEGRISRDMSFNDIGINCHNSPDFKFNYSSKSFNDGFTDITRIETILNYLSPTTGWHQFAILIKYEIPNFVMRQGSHQIAWVNYNGAIESLKDTSFNVLITLPSGSSIIERIPDTAKLRDRYNGRWVVELTTPGNNQIWFTDVDETEKWAPFRWAFLGAIIGFFLEILFGDPIKKFLEPLKV